ncbi:MAG: hypothetical protein KCHDKBKB_00132 [Elusimicrobia bacterium]|nr:hypothetical protein [Elusimicrobiota bacterium]
MSRVSKKETQISPAKVSVVEKGIYALLGLLHVLSALFFYTNLTRNPYFTQIAALYIFIAVIGLLWVIQAWSMGTFSIPQFDFDKPLFLFLAVAFVSTVWSWWYHSSLRPGIGYEATRVWIFTLVNCGMTLFLPMLFSKPLRPESPKISIWTDLFLALGWGLLWLGFHSNRDPNPTLVIWDSYGGFVWVLGGLYAILRTRRGEAIEFFHVVFAVAFIAGIYGLMQYFGKDLIWSSLIMPYGGRPVSSFGNPNFLSSYVMMVCPVSLAFGLKSENENRWGYFLVALVSALTVMCTLTRSSYVGLFVSLAVLGVLVFPINRTTMMKFLAVALGGFVLLVFVFPKTPIFALQSPLLRFTEIIDAMKSGQPYGPWHQRILIWSSAWDMLLQNHWLGKGWGSFELFYPFFQGKYLYAPLLSGYRTHANNAHNILMELWSQLGFLGTGVVLWMFVTMVVGGWRIFRRQTFGLAQYVSAALLSAMLGMVADNFFGNVSIFFATPAFLFWWFVGALFNQQDKNLLPPRQISPRIGRPFLILFGAFSLLVGVYYFKRWKQEIYYFEGFRQAKNGDVVRSVKALEKAYAWFPGEVNTNYELGNSYARYAQMMLNQGLPEEAASYEKKAMEGFLAALRANPGYDEIYFNLGVTQSGAGSKQEALRNLELSLYINPLLKESYGALGNLYLQMNDTASAAKTFARSVEAFPTDKDLWNNLGYCYSLLKEPQKSFDSYKKAVQIDAAFQQGWQNLILSAQELLKIDPHNKEAREAVSLLNKPPR